MDKIPPALEDTVPFEVAVFTTMPEYLEVESFTGDLLITQYLWYN